MIRNHTCRLLELMSVSVLEYTDIYYLEIWTFSRNTGSVKSLPTSFVHTCTVAGLVMVAGLPVDVC